MILKNIITITALLLYTGNICNAQVKPLIVGDRVPDITIHNVINYPTTQVRLSDFKGKLLILDFWATWCLPCISMIPVCDSLQRTFEDELCILPVAAQDKKTVTAFIQNMRQARNISFPSVTGDTLLKKMFPHTEIPHYVWIDGTGQVIAITGADKMNKSVIGEYLKTGIITATTKTDKSKHINEKQPMFRVANELLGNDTASIDVLPNDDLLYHSVITGHIEGFGCETGGDTNRIVCKNESIGGLYRYALCGLDITKIYLNSTAWQVTNPAVLPYTDSAELRCDTKALSESWMQQYTFCYELKYPDISFEKKAAIMLQDLNNYFGARFNIHGCLEKIPVKILALVRTGQGERYAAGGTTEPAKSDAFFLRMKNQPVAALVNILAGNMDLLPPVVDATGYKGNIDIELHCDLSNLAEVNKALAVYDLALQEREEVREMIVIKDKQ